MRKNWLNSKANILLIASAIYCGFADNYELTDICYASANIKALETLRYAEHICNYLVI